MIVITWPFTFSSNIVLLFRNNFPIYCITCWSSSKTFGFIFSFFSPWSCWCRLGVSDTQTDSIQYLNFANKLFNSIFNSIVFHENSIQKIIQFNIFHKNSIKKIIQLKKFQKNPIQKIIQLKNFNSIGNSIQ